MPEAFLLVRDRFLCDVGPIAEPNCVTPGRPRQQHGYSVVRISFQNTMGTAHPWIRKYFGDSQFTSEIHEFRDEVRVEPTHNLSSRNVTTAEQRVGIKSSTHLITFFFIKGPRRSRGLSRR